MKLSKTMIILLPIIELILFIEVGSVIGSLYVVLSIFITIFLGYYLIRQNLRNISFKVFRVTSIEDIYKKYTSSIYSFVGGILLIVPGYLTDILGIAIMLPIFRPKLSSYMDKKYGKKSSKSNIIEGEYRDND